MPAIHEDPQLGVLTRRRGRWRGELELDGGRVPLAVVGGRGGPDEATLAIARRAGEDLASCRPALEAALAEHREPYDVGGDGWAVEWASVEPLAGDLTLEVGLRTAWDEEHTLGARIRGGQLVELNGSVLSPVTVQGFRVLDADAHVVEPPHVFAAWSDVGPTVIDLAADTPMVPCGDAELIADQMAHGFDAPSYLRAMDAQGIDAVVLYPSIGLFVPFQPELDPAQSAAACRSYNKWLAGYCAEDERRMAGVGLIPLADVDLAVTEAEHAAGLGLVGVLARPNHLYGRNLGDPYYDPLHACLAEAGLVLAVHEGLGLRGPTIGGDRFDGFTARHLLSHPMEQMAAMASLVLDGALARHPDLRVAFLESGTGWLPYWLHRLDEHLEWMDPDAERASALFARQCIISTEADDALTASVVDHVGADHVVWASDFPHPDALFPDAATTFVAEARAQQMSDADLATVLWDSPLAFYRLADRFT